MSLFRKSSVKRFSRLVDNFSKTTVEEIMTKKVFTISPEEKVIDAANLMIAQNISGLVVQDPKDKSLLGIITERDFLGKEFQNISDMQEQTVEDMVSKDLVTVHPSLKIMDAAELMDKHKFRKLVVATQGRLEGIITQTDLVDRMDALYHNFPFNTSDSLTVRSIMKKVVTVKTSDSLASAKKQMNKNKTGSLYVVKDDKLVGTFTEFDLLSNIAMNKGSLTKIKMETVMSFPLVAISSNVDIFDANHLMAEKNFRRMPVLEDGSMVGKVTQTLIRKGGFDVLRKCIERAQNKDLEKVNFKKVKERLLVRKIRGQIQEYVYPEEN